MGTLYELFKVTENASQEEIKASYDNIIEKANSLPQSDKLTEQIRRVKIAYGILSNEEKRKKYDLDLATKRADELLQSVKIQEKTNEVVEEKNSIEEKSSTEEKQEATKQNHKPQINEERIRQEIDKQIQNLKFSNEPVPQKQELTEKEIKKQQKKLKRQAKKEQQLKREMQINAYGQYLEKQGYKVKYPWTWPRVKRLLITIIVTIITLVILWQIPAVRKPLVELYNENFLIKIIVDLILSIFSSIVEGIKGIFK